MNGVEEGRDEMSDAEEDAIGGEELLAPPDRRARAGPRNKPMQSMKQHSYRSKTGAHTA